MSVRRRADRIRINFICRGARVARASRFEGVRGAANTFWRGPPAGSLCEYLREVLLLWVGGGGDR